MNTIHQFIDQNMPLIYFLYGLGFFMLGLAAAIQYRAQSNLKLVRNLWVLALFGVCHGLVEWGNVFIPIQVASLPPDLAILVRAGQVFLHILSFVILVQLGVNLVIDEEMRGKRLARLLPGFLFLLWAIAFVVGFTLTDKAGVLTFLTGAESLGKYFFALPGAVLTGLGLAKQSRDFVGPKLAKARSTAMYASILFYFYALFGGIIVPGGNFFPANILNENLFHEHLNLPVEFFRIIIVYLLIYHLFNLFAHFEDELVGRLEWAECQYSVANERLRISRDLHDGILQTVYAMGLRCENIKHLLETDMEQAKAEICRTMSDFNQLIAEIRDFIGELRVDTLDQTTLYTQLQDLVEEFAARNQMVVRADLSSVQDVRICPKITEQIVGVAREALNNAFRHSEASEVIIEAQKGKHGLWLQVSDNGKGFKQPSPLMAKFTLGHQGISNMRDRAKLLGGELEVRSTLGKGTKVSLYLPNQGLNQVCGGGVTCGGCGFQTYSHTARR
ncbi:MAG: sensor histidine kinase [Firmicutes bacterium]|nr:sensor histidine kinase [Bacillota bacterium]